MLTPADARSLVVAPPRPPRWLPRLLIGGALAGALGFALALAAPAPAPRRAWQALFVNLLFFAGWAQAGVLFSALMRLTRARWGVPLSRLAESSVIFVVAAPLGLALLFAGGEGVMPWIAHPRPELGNWLERRFVMARELLAWGLIAVAAAAFVAASLRRDLGWLGLADRGAGRAEYRGEARGGRLERWLTRSWRGEEHEVERAGRRLDNLAVVLALAYVFGLSLTAFDLIMPLEPHWRSALLGGHLFMSTLYLGIAGLAVATRLAAGPLGLSRALDPERLSDLGKLLSALALFTTYLFYSQFLPIWYGNLREEVSFVLPRLYHAPWRGVAFIVLAAAYLGPFLLLLRAGMKRRLSTLGGVALIATAGLWLERYLLVVPSLWSEPWLPLGLVEALVTVGFLSAFTGSCLLFLCRFPALPVGDPRLYEQPSPGP
jgi:hypothetical protein